MTTNFFSPMSFIAVFGSVIRDLGSGMGKNQDPGSGINIPDQPHWGEVRRTLDFLYVHYFSTLKQPNEMSIIRRVLDFSYTRTYTVGKAD